MKLVKKLFLLELLVCSLVFFSSCGGENAATDAANAASEMATDAVDAAKDAAADAVDKVEEALDKSGPEYTSAYVCPMHCKGSGSAEPGKCPACGMEYVMNADHKADGHDHDDHEGHNH